MGRSVRQFIYIQALLLSLARVLAVSEVPELDVAHQAVSADAAGSSRIHETVLVARQLRVSSERRLFGCDRTLPAIQNALGAGGGASCSCRDIAGGTLESSVVTCLDYCELCQDDLNLCVTFGYEFSFSDGSLNNFLGKLQYSGSRTDLLEFQETYGNNGQDIVSCYSKVNQDTCTSCSVSPVGCGDQVRYDCTNVESGAIYDECQGDFDQIPSTSVFVAYNTNFFNDGDCVVFPTVSPAPTEFPPLTTTPTLAPTVFAQQDTTATLAPTEGPTRPPFITYPILRTTIGVQYLELDDDQFIDTVTNYLLAESFQFFPTIVGLVADRIAPPPGMVPPNFVEVGLEGEAVFLGTAPNQAEFEAAQRYILQDIVGLQEAVTANQFIGRDVFIDYVLVHPDTLAPTRAPTRAPLPIAKGKGNLGPTPWGFRPPKSKKHGKGMKGKKHKEKSGKKKSSKHYIPKPPSPKYKAPSHSPKKKGKVSSPTYHHPWKMQWDPSPSKPTWHVGGMTMRDSGGMTGSWTWGGMKRESSNGGFMSRNFHGSVGGAWSRMQPNDYYYRMGGGTWARRMGDKNGRTGGGTWVRRMKPGDKSSVAMSTTGSSPFGQTWRKKKSSSRSMMMYMSTTSFGGGGFGAWSMMQSKSDRTSRTKMKKWYYNMGDGGYYGGMMMMRYGRPSNTMHSSGGFWKKRTMPMNEDGVQT